MARIGAFFRLLVNSRRSGAAIKFPDTNCLSSCFLYLLKYTFYSETSVLHLGYIRPSGKSGLFTIRLADLFIILCKHIQQTEHWNSKGVEEDKWWIKKGTVLQDWKVWPWSVQSFETFQEISSLLNPMLSDSQKASHFDLVLHKKTYHHLQRMINIIIHHYDQPTTKSFQTIFCKIKIDPTKISSTRSHVRKLIWPTSRLDFSSRWYVTCV